MLLRGVGYQLMRAQGRPRAVFLCDVSAASSNIFLSVRALELERRNKTNLNHTHFVLVSLSQLSATVLPPQLCSLCYLILSMV